MSGLALKNPIILALDVDGPEEAMALAQKLGSQVGAIKLGPRLVLRAGPQWVQAIAKIAPVFLDFKFLDIPSTMESAVRAAFDMDATLVTIHAWAGPVALQRMCALEKELQQKRPFQVLCVTILTSFEQNNLPLPLNRFDIHFQVSELVKMAAAVGLRGFVCSPHEAALISEQVPDAYIVTPGIRMPDEATQDQKRVCTPAEAIARGAKALVIGRPILAAPNPSDAISTILQGMQ